VLRLTHSGTVLGLTTAARYAPILLLSPYAGLMVDRHSKRMYCSPPRRGSAWSRRCSE
jgi:hypothetical protein